MSSTRITKSLHRVARSWRADGRRPADPDVRIPDTRMPRVGYRMGQFWRGLRARLGEPLTHAERGLVSATLPPGALSLFERMAPNDQRHSLDVLCTVYNMGYTQPDLAAAALLHDVGKAAAADNGLRLGLWLRGPLVVGDALAPNWLARLAAPEPHRGWRYLLHVYREHAAIGADWARQAGCTALSCWLIASHQTPVDAAATSSQTAFPQSAFLQATDLLTILQYADSSN